MGRYVLRRLLIAIPTLLIISFVIFMILVLAPGDPLSQFGADPRVPPEVRENIKHALGLDQPPPIRYVNWVTAMLRADFGYSFMSHSPVLGLIQQRLPTTLAVVGAGASGTEIASAYARLGVEVTLFEALERVIPPRTLTSPSSPSAG